MGVVLPESRSSWRLTFCFRALTCSSDPRPSTGVESTPPRPSVGEATPPSPKRVEAPRSQEQEGAPKPPRSGVEGDPITISGWSGGDRLSKDARSTDEEVEASPVTKRTPWTIGLHSVEEKRKKEEEERERETQQRLQEGQQQPHQGGEEEKEGRQQQGDQFEELLEQDRQQELREL